MNLNDGYMNHINCFALFCGVSFKVLKHCSKSPRTIEVLLNAYSYLKVTDTWVESVSAETFKASSLNY